jgi:hypothetical protein
LFFLGLLGRHYRGAPGRDSTGFITKISPIL